jgi:acyl-coenzyme A thioesterase PaaI-like protein
LPPEAVGFTTIELKTNFLATAREGALRCRAEIAHGGSRTQVWDANVSREEDERVIALFRCTQFLLPREDPRTERQRAQRDNLEAARQEKGR